MGIEGELRKAIGAAVSKGRTQRDIAERVPMDAVSLNRFMRGARGVSAEMADKIAAALGFELALKRKRGMK